MRCVFLAIVVAPYLGGCEAKEQPVLSHGKPVEHWLAELRKSDPQSRKKAIIALGHVGASDAAAVPAIIEAVKDRDAKVRAEAVLALLNIGPSAADAIPALEEAQMDRDARVRDYAAKALKRIQNSE